MLQIIGKTSSVESFEDCLILCLFPNARICCIENRGLYNSLSWNTVFYSQQYGLNVKESAFLSVLPSIVGVICGVTAGFSADKIIDNVCKDDNIDAKTNIRKAFQALALIGPGACLFALANQVPDDPGTAQALLTGAVALQAFNVAGYSAGPQEKGKQYFSDDCIGMISSRCSSHVDVILNTLSWREMEWPIIQHNYATRCHVWELGSIRHW